VLKQLAGKVQESLHKVPGTRDVVNPVATDRLDLDMQIDEGKAALLDIPAGSPRRIIELALSGSGRAASATMKATAIRSPCGCRLNNSQPVSALDSDLCCHGQVPGRAWAILPIRSWSSVAPLITRRNLERTVEITAQTQDGALPSKITQAAKAKLDKIKLPLGYSIRVGGEAEKINDTFPDFGPVILIALFIIFGILVAEFGEFREALVVAGVIPLGTFGGLIGCW
jgi:multidrug efflux pump subunit AcrB